MKNKIYKIQNKDTGLYSSGTLYIRWTKTGKVWTNIGHLKNHLNLFIDYKGNKVKNYPYENAEIIEIEINYSNGLKIDINELIKTMSKSKE